MRLTSTKRPLVAVASARAAYPQRMSDQAPGTGSARESSPATALVRIESVTVRNLRGLTECTLALEPTLTVLVGRNSSGKSRLLRALALACGAVNADADDFTAGSEESPTIDLVLAPAVGADTFDGRVAAVFAGNVQPVSEDAERIAWRTSIQPSAEGWGGRAESRFLRYDIASSAWNLPRNAAPLSREHRGMVAADLVGTGRDLAAEMSRPGSPVRRVLSDLGVPDAQRGALEADLQALSARIVETSDSLAAVRGRLAELDREIGGVGTPVMNPLPGRLEELARTIEIALDNTGLGPLPMRLHGSGARSLASLQVQSVLYDRQLGRDGGDLPTHPVTLLEEPEAHLHPQACFDLAALLKNMTGQVVASTHSSHLVTVVPTEAIRLVRQDDGRTVLRDLHPVDARTATPAALRLGVSHLEWEKLKRLVERPFGELLFANAVVIGDGASERAFLPHLLRHALGPAAAGVCVVDPGGMSQAGLPVKFADGVGIPCILFCDADGAGTKDESQLPASAERVWATGSPGTPGDLESVLCEFDEEWCLRQCEQWLPGVVGRAHERMDQLKGTYGNPFGRAFVTDFPGVSTWPLGFQRLIEALRPAVATAEAADG